MVEVLNTGIEAACDAFSREFHIDIQLAKDCGSLAVLISVILVAGVWGIAMVERITGAAGLAMSSYMSVAKGNRHGPGSSQPDLEARPGLPDDLRFLAREISARGLAGARQHPRHGQYVARSATTCSASWAGCLTGAIADYREGE